MDDKTKYWMIVFEDQDRQNIIITDEEIARKAYKKYLYNWACHLFEMIENNGKAI